MTIIHTASKVRPTVDFPTNWPKAPGGAAGGGSTTVNTAPAISEVTLWDQDAGAWAIRRTTVPVDGSAPVITWHNPKDGAVRAAPSSAVLPFAREAKAENSFAHDFGPGTYTKASLLTVSGGTEITGFSVLAKLGDITLQRGGSATAIIEAGSRDNMTVAPGTDFTIIVPAGAQATIAWDIFA